LWAVGEKTTVVDTSTKSVIKQFSIWSLGHVDFSKDGRYAYMTTLQAFGAKKDLVIMFDTTTLEIKQQVEVQTSPNEVELSPDGSLIYVAEYDSNDVTILDSNLKVVATVPAGKGAHGLGISPDGRWLYVANRKTDYVSVIDTVSRKETARIKVGEGPNHIIVSPDGRFVYVSNLGSANISIIDASSLIVVGSIRVGNAPHEMTIVHLYEVNVSTRIYTISTSGSAATSTSTGYSTPSTTSTINFETLLTRKDNGEGGTWVQATLLTKEYLQAEGEDPSQYDLNRNIVFKVYVDTHSGSLLNYTFQQLFFLRDDKGNIYPAIEWKDLALDSHHRSGILKFSKFDGNGVPIIRYDTKYVELVAKDSANVPERVLRWDLPIPNVSTI